MKTARQLAAEALMKVEAGGYSNIVFDHAAKQAAGSAAADLDIKFAGALFYGVLERELSLDEVIARHSRIPPAKLDPQVRAILRMALYQIFYMDSVPDSAAVNEAVKLTAVLRKKSAGPYVNGLLRNVLREGKGAPDSSLSLETGIPAWILRLWEKAYGQEAAEKASRAFQGRGRLYARANPFRNTAGELCGVLSGEGVAASADQELDGCVLLEGTGRIPDLKAFREGRFHIQDKAAQACALAVDPRPGQQILDVCAAPGGKTFLIAEQLGQAGCVTAMDLHPRRVELIREGAARLGLGNIRVEAGDASAFREDFAGRFDRVLCDVPCSGLGIMGRKPEIRHKKPEDLEKLPQIQYKILQTSADYCKRGGLLVYATCTLNPAENEAVIARFLRERKDFVPAPVEDGEPYPFPEGRDTGTATLFPYLHHTDGFFFCRLRRREGT